MAVSKTVESKIVNGFVCGANKNERVILWDDDTFERVSHAEFSARFVK